MADTIGIKSKERVKDLGEVFTREETVEEMLGLPEIMECAKSLSDTFLEPSCGNGNFLVGIYDKKFYAVDKATELNNNLDLNLVKAISTVYGVDIMVDNVIEARERLNTMVSEYYKSRKGAEMESKLSKVVSKIIERNIIAGDTLKRTMASKADMRRKGKNSIRVEFTKPLEFSEWRFNGEEVQRLPFGLDDPDKILHYNYDKIHYLELAKQRDIEFTQDDEVE